MRMERMRSEKRNGVNRKGKQSLWRCKNEEEAGGIAEVWREFRAVGGGK